MKQYGKVELFFESIDPTGFGDRVRKTLNIYTENSTLPMIYVNVETSRQEQTYDDGVSWNLIGVTTEHTYDVYINKTIDDVLVLYKTNPSFDTVTWITNLSEFN